MNEAALWKMHCYPRGVYWTVSSLLYTGLYTESVQLHVHNKDTQCYTILVYTIVILQAYTSRPVTVIHNCVYTRGIRISHNRTFNVRVTKNDDLITR